jgi:protein-disulfide isomerase
VVEPEIAKLYLETGKARLIWHDFAWIGEESRLAAQAARCAGRQGKFWEYHDHLYANQRGENQGHFGPNNLRNFADSLELEAVAFRECLEKKEDLAAIQQDLAVARSRGVVATPSFLINGQLLVAASAERLSRAIEAELARLGQ